MDFYLLQEDASGDWSERKAQSEDGSNTSSYRRKLVPFIFIFGVVWPHNIIFLFLQSYATQKWLFLHHLLRNDQIHSNSSIFRRTTHLFNKDTRRNGIMTSLDATVIYCCISFWCLKYPLGLSEPLKIHSIIHMIIINSFLNQ